MKKTLAVLIVSILFGLTTSPTNALAAWRRQHGSTCFQQNNLNASFYNETTGLINNTGFQQTFICPYADDSFLPRTNVWTLNLHGQKNTPSGQDSAFACVKNWGWYGFQCGIGTTVTTNASWAMALFADYWRSFPADFAYIKVTLQPGSGIFGFFVSE